MNEPHPQRLAQDHDHWRLYTVAAAGASFFAGMLVNNWIAPSSRASLRRGRLHPPAAGT